MLPSGAWLVINRVVAPYLQNVEDRMLSREVLVTNKVTLSRLESLLMSQHVVWKHRDEATDALDVDDPKRIVSSIDVAVVRSM